MIKHKHAELIKLWADGKTIQMLNRNTYAWFDISEPNWHDSRAEFRIKPERKPDTVTYLYQSTSFRYHWSEFSVDQLDPDNKPYRPCIKVVYDGETGEPKSTELLRSY